VETNSGLLVNEIDEIKYEKLFSVCTLVANKDEYEALLSSAEKAGFTNHNSEFLYIDNSQTNKYNAFDGLNQFLNHSKGKYIILVHQDVEFNFDNVDVLIKRIEQMNKLDPTWAVLGNAGYDIKNITRQYTRITDPGHSNQQDGPFPSQVSCLDEDIMIVKNDLNLMFSKNIGHFHLYGADLCLQATMQGYHNYVIDFHILHKSGGFPNQSFYDTKNRLISQYENSSKVKFLRTPCTVLFLSNSKVLNFLMNRKIMYSLKKRYDTFKSRLKGEKVLNNSKTQSKCDI